MIEIKRLNEAYQEAFENINRVTLDGLAHKDWFMPLCEEEMQKLFTSDSPYTVYGAFVDGTLAGVSLLDRTKEEFACLAEAAGVSEDKKGAEMGISMVLPEYRGRGLMVQIDTALIEAAKAEGLDYLVATAHPDNIASNISLRKMGMLCIDTIMREGKYLRNVYYLPFSKTEI